MPYIGYTSTAKNTIQKSNPRLNSTGVQLFNNHIASL